MAESEREYNEADNGELNIEGEYAQLASTSSGLRSLMEQVSDKLGMGESFPKKPSTIKYLILGYVALCIDVLDFLAIDIVGPLHLLMAVLSICGTIFIFFILWITNTKFVNARKYNRTILTFLQEVRENLAHATRTAMRVAKISRFIGKRIPAARKAAGKVSRGITRGLVKIRRLARGNPLTKVVVTSTLNIIPILSFVPWMVVGIILSYLDERKTYINTKELTADLKEEWDNASETLESVDETMAMIEEVVMQEAA